MKTLILCFSLTLAAAPLLGQTPKERRAKLIKTGRNLRILSGNASVIDARTLSVDGKNVRLKWIEPLPVYSPATRRSPLKLFQAAEVSV